MTIESGLDEYEGKIYDFIRKNPDCNQSAVRYSRMCSEMWAIEKLNSLVKKGYVEDRRIGKSFHRYRVRDRKQYNLIIKELDTIETEIIFMKKPLLEIAELQDRLGASFVAGFIQHLVIPYHDSAFTRLFRLLKISDTVGKEDSLRLHTRIISLIAKVTREPFYDLNYKQIITGNKNLLNSHIRDLLNPGTVKTGLSVDNLKRLVKNIERFEDRFGY